MMTVDFILSDIQQRLARLIQVGVIASVDAANSLGTVTIGGNTSASLKIMQHRAGADVSYTMPSVGEQCLVLFPSGNMDAGFILPAIHSTTNIPGADDSDIHRMTYADGTVIEYDQGTSTLTATCVGDVMIDATGDVTVNSGGTATVDAATQADLTAPIVNVNATTSATITSPIITLAGAVTATGAITATGEIVGNGVAVSTHTHDETGSVTLGPN